MKKLESNAGKTILITGSTSGFGAAAAVDFGRQEARILVTGRNRERGEAVVAEITKAGGKAEFISADLLSLKEIDKLIQAIKSRTESLDILINNAGDSFFHKRLSADGIEATFALHAVAPFALTNHLHSHLARAHGRVVNIVTRMPPNPRFDVDDLVNPRSYRGFNRYTISKVALLMLTLEEAERWRSDNILAVALFPGIHPWTRFGRDTPAIMTKVGRLGARITGLGSTLDEIRKRYEIASFSNLPSGTFLAKGIALAPPTITRDASVRSKLWQLLQKITAN